MNKLFSRTVTVGKQAFKAFHTLTVNIRGRVIEKPWLTIALFLTALCILQTINIVFYATGLDVLVTLVTAMIALTAVAGITCATYALKKVNSDSAN
jgi:hypothetical protein